jgi:hypothetical protein
MELIQIAQAFPRPSQKRKHPSSNEDKPVRERDVLTPGSSPHPFGPSPRPQVSDKFQRFFPSSPINQIEEFKTPPVVIEVKDTPRSGTPEKGSSDRASTRGVSDSDPIKYVDFVGLQTDDLQTVIGKISMYAQHIYSYARKEGCNGKVRKYSRKLKRLTEHMPRSEA